MENSHQSLAHSRWDCKYHVVFVPKRRRQQLYGQIRRQLGAIFHALARQKECQIVEGHVMPDHVHMCIAIPPKYAVAQVIGFLKGKSDGPQGSHSRIQRKPAPDGRLPGAEHRQWKVTDWRECRPPCDS